MQNDTSTAIAVLQTINHVDGFDPTPLAVPYTDLNTNETRKRLPVQVQMGWFRLKYPSGKIAISVQPSKDYFVATARVYADHNDPMDCFLAEASATRGKDPSKPTVSPREWAQTAAVGIALRNAGFGLSFDAAGDAFDQPAVDEMDDLQFTKGTDGPVQQPPAFPPDVPFDVETPVPMGAPASAVPFPEQPAAAQVQPQPGPALAPVAVAQPAAAATTTQPVSSLEQALQLPCPIKQHAGKTLGEVLQIDSECIAWIANKYKSDPVIAEGARIICEHALNQASA